MFSRITLTLTLIYFISITGSFCLEGDISFRFANHYSDHMVLQREPYRSFIWGIGQPNATVMLVVKNGETGIEDYYRSVVREDGRGLSVWNITLQPYKSGGPYAIIAYSVIDNQRVEAIVDDILFGDVWVCSGQSNMVFTVGMSDNAELEIALASSYPSIRLFTISRYHTNVTVPELSKSNILQDWSVPSKDSVGGANWQYFSAVCWMYGRKLFDLYGIPIGLISTSYGGTDIESWSSPVTMNECRDDEWKPQNTLYNAMIYPIMNTTIYGVLWYQGENNALDFDDNPYDCTFPALIGGWRRDWYEATHRTTKQTFPFGFVQLSTKDDNTLPNLPDIRWKQTANYGYVPNPKQPNTFMAVAMDLPDDHSPYGSIHPCDKTDVANRLILAARNIAYGEKDVYWTGPLFDRVEVTLTDFSTVELMVFYKDSSLPTGGIEIRSNNGFEVNLNNNKNWTAVDVAWNAKNRVQLILQRNSSDPVIGLRYAWSQKPCAFKRCAIYAESSSLPSPPFIVFDKDSRWILK